jgi:hypothetical protein
VAFKIFFACFLWIRSGINADPDPDPALCLNADPDPGSQISVGPDPGQTFKSQKLNFSMKNLVLKVGKSKVQKTCLKGRKLGEFLWISMLLDLHPDPHSQYPDLDSGRPNECGSRSTTLMVMILIL